ncbi:nucleotide exchange factor GrpE [Candidatus Kaiserbacteria bacterium]|nr:nucleotide exchange factor GrpE [Candidatus Kaiserbacteria bacterium]
MIDKKTNEEEEFIPEIEESEHADEVTLEEVEQSSTGKIKKIKDQLKRCEEEKSKLQDDLQRTKADFLNTKKRLQEDSLRASERSTIKHLESLLPLCDSFRMAMSDKAVWENVDENWRKGVEGIENQLQSILKKHNVEAIDPTGNEFDPNEHEAMGELPVEDDAQHHKVLSVMQLGYVINRGNTKELLRPARVMVGIKKESN